MWVGGVPKGPGICPPVSFPPCECLLVQGQSAVPENSNFTHLTDEKIFFFFFFARKSLSPGDFSSQLDVDWLPLLLVYFLRSSF